MRITATRAAGIALASIGIAAACASTAAAAAITEAQRARLEERLRLAEQVLRVVDADAATRGIAPDQRKWLQESLYTMPLEKLRTLGTPPTFSTASSAVVAALKAQPKTPAKALGDAGTDLVYLPITPCRFIDTRNVPATLPATFNLGSAGNVYGGSAGCNIVTASGVTTVDSIAAVSMNVAIVNPNLAPGFLGVRPNGSANTTALVNWYEVGPTVQASNAAVITSAQNGAVADDLQFFGTQTQFVVDVMGVFAAPAATALDCNTKRTQGAGTNNLPDGTDYVFPIATVCDAGYTAVAIGCEYGPSAPKGLTLTSASTPDSLFYVCTWRNDTGTTLDQANFNTHTRCCRVPGR